MSRHYERAIAAGTPSPKPPPARTERMTRDEIENLIRATVLPGGHRISAAAVRRITDAWIADTDTAIYADRAPDGCTYTNGAGCYYG